VPQPVQEYELFLPLSDKAELKRALRQEEILIIERDVQAL
jgi:hypothetical protein